MFLEKRRLKSTADKIESSDKVHEIFILQEDGTLRREVHTTDELEEMNLHPPYQNEVFLEGSANSIKSLDVDLDYDADEVVFNDTDNGFIPRKEWEVAMDTKFLHEAFHKKRDFDIPWTPLIAVGVIVLGIIMVTQTGMI